ncbi:hypothetical protein PGT21_020991 [Puccinia graminis f. sp. tritici]|uniref:Uncharacterized protein n=1 Tax=Puccinia graminis f. sp. tritici TaxID=56615 RepID=A0A5B0PNN7_PUCGR|nr:hypothetical protein PGTUg99_016418 [Puccinia graminis f. sp. tritici]KAA1105823.1 hypothetical protein PGT21_020991 [Puccinia graminis f. sp. tritici]KAA1135094.1 hypothetical protein PGTUg99_007777 [Puccinia graminis f. sp. tritici]
MELSAAALWFTFVVLIAIAHAPRYPNCPADNCGNKCRPLSIDEVAESSLPPQGQCGWKSAPGSGPNFVCDKSRDKAYYHCDKCNKIVGINTSHQYVESLPCNHRVSAFVPVPSHPDPGSSNPGPSKPDTREPYLHSFFPTKPE